MCQAKKKHSICSTPCRERATVFSMLRWIFGWVPRDPQLIRAVARSQMVVTGASDAPSAKAFVVLAERMIEMTSVRVRIKGNVQFFFRRMLEGGRAAQ